MREKSHFVCVIISRHKSELDVSKMSKPAIHLILPFPFIEYCTHYTVTLIPRHPLIYNNHRQVEICGLSEDVDAGEDAAEQLEAEEEEEVRL